MFFLWLHNLICALAFGGNAPDWLIKLHRILGLG